MMYANKSGCTTSDNPPYLHKGVCFLSFPLFILCAIHLAHLRRNAGKGGKRVPYD